MTNRPLNIFVCHASGHLTDTLPHGDGLIACSMLRHLAERGHTLHVAVNQYTLVNELPHNLHLHPLSARNMVSYVGQARRLFSRLNAATRFDVIHQMNPVFTALSLGMAGTGLPCVIGPYWGNWLDAGPQVEHKTWKERIRLQLCYWQQRHATAILLANEAARINLEKSGAAQIPGIERKMFILPPGIDTATFSPDAVNSGGMPSILYLANVVRRKGIFTLLDAFDRVAHAIPDCQLYVGGEGPELAEAKARAARSVRPDNVHFLGKIQREDVAATMRQFDVYCLPSFGEPFGMSVLEAMACGKPVVVTDAGGVAELAPAEGSRKVPPGDPEALADALIEVAASPHLQRSMGLANRRVATELYDWPNVVERLERIYWAVTRYGNEGTQAATQSLGERHSKHQLNHSGGIKSL